MEKFERYFSIDVETAGPNPSSFALLSIGACSIQEPRATFYTELIPDKPAITDEALAVSNLPLERLREQGTPPKAALGDFADWVAGNTPNGFEPVFVAFNAPFDWMFVNDYFHRYLGYNPFGHKALDIKALYMGACRTSWFEASYHQVSKTLKINNSLTHHALEDALQQADIFQALLETLGGK